MENNATITKGFRILRDMLAPYIAHELGLEFGSNIWWREGVMKILRDDQKRNLPESGDYATLTDNNGRKADFRNVILIMTSNAGARDIGKNLIGFGERTLDESAVDGAVEKIFTPEFRNRLDAVVRFGHLSREIMISIVNKELNAFRDQLAEKKVSLDVTPSCVEKLAEEGYSKEFGARNVGRVMEERIKSFFVDEVLFGRLSSGGKARADFSGGEYSIEILESAAEITEDSSIPCEI